MNIAILGTPRADRRALTRSSGRLTNGHGNPLFLFVDPTPTGGGTKRPDLSVSDMFLSVVPTGSIGLPSA